MKHKLIPVVEYGVKPAHVEVVLGLGYHPLPDEG